MPDRGMLMAGLVVAGVLGVAAGRAGALDLTGTWEGRLVCKGLRDGVPERFKCCEDVLISQTGDTLHVHEVGTDLRYFGRAQARASNPDKGTAVLVGCETDSTLPPYSEMAFLEAVVNPAKGKGTLKGSGPFLVHTGNDKLHFFCKWNFKRVSTDDPDVAPCP